MHSDISYIGEDSSDYDKIRPHINQLIHEEDYYYDKEKFSLHVRSKRRGEKTIVFSCEDIMGGVDSKRCAMRLREVFKGAKVLMVIRNQLDVWPSWYVNHGAYLKNVPKKFWQRYVPIEDWLEYCFAFPTKTPVEAMNYWKYYKIFSDIFGEEKMCVLMYEEMIKDIDVYAQKLSHILKIDKKDVTNAVAHVERSRNTRQKFLVHKYFSHWPAIRGKLDNFFSGMGGSDPFQPSISKQWRERVGKYYAAGNARLLNKQPELKMSKYGYPLASECQ